MTSGACVTPKNQFGSSVVNLHHGRAFQLRDGRSGVILPGSIETRNGALVITRWHQLFRHFELPPGAVAKGRDYWVWQGDILFEVLPAEEIHHTFWALPLQLLSPRELMGVEVGYGQGQNRDKIVIGSALVSERLDQMSRTIVLQPIKQTAHEGLPNECLAMVMNQCGALVLRQAQAYIRKAMDDAANRVSRPGDAMPELKNTIMLKVDPRVLLAIAATSGSSLMEARYKNHEVHLIFEDLEVVLGLPKGPMRLTGRIFQWGYPAAFKVRLFPTGFSAISFSGFKVMSYSGSQVYSDSIRNEQSKEELMATLTRDPPGWRIMCDVCWDCNRCMCPRWPAGVPVRFETAFRRADDHTPLQAPLPVDDTVTGYGLHSRASELPRVPMATSHSCKGKFVGVVASSTLTSGADQELCSGFQPECSFESSTGASAKRSRDCYESQMP